MNKKNQSNFMMPNRRQVVGGLGAALGLGAFGRAFAQSNAADWKKFSGTNLRLLLVNHWWTDAIKSRIAEFEALTGMTVTLDILTEDNYYQKAAVELSAGTSNYDALMVGNLQAGQYMSAGWLAPLGDIIGSNAIIDSSWYNMDDVFASGRAAGTMQNKLMALPISTECEVVMYRTDLLEKAGIGPIETMDQLVSAASALNKDGVSGIVGRGRRGLDIVWVWTGYLLTQGGDFFKDGKSALGSDASKMAADTYLNKLLKQNGPQGTANMSWLEASAVFKEGKAALWTDASGLLAVTLDKSTSKVADTVGAYAWPSSGSNAPAPNYWFWLIGMPAKSKNPDAASLFIAWATSPEVSMQVGRKTGSPVARASVWADEDFTKFFPGNTAAQVSKSLASVQPERVPFSDPKFPQVVDALSVELVNILTGSKDVDTGMNDANTAVDEVMNG
ncbi:ABC transporter substrate-binding protein [Kaistia algarum]|uniref:ABC transporter substrate-binding protein n=1 Tax=Kaistia algarum TaxID=2083279 RepID=UPI001402A450|nr:sugar ABC transporter substrate-binding protein [Kaistia algarum]MCX5516741.1 sugar ABC transporter substrate-binding protein [Kaistia algarum]